MQMRSFLLLPFLSLLLLFSLATRAAAQSSLGKGRISVTADFSRIVDSTSGRVYADRPYRYGLQARIRGKVLTAEGLVEVHRSERRTAAGREYLTQGKLEGTTIHVVHRVVVSKSEDFFDEHLVLKNEGKAPYELRHLSFGFRKSLDPSVEPFRLVAVPYRRQMDRKLHDYSFAEILEGEFHNSEWRNLAPPVLGEFTVDTYRGGLSPANLGRSEGWVWTDGAEGLLVIKYNNEAIEYSTRISVLKLQS